MELGRPVARHIARRPHESVEAAAPPKAPVEHTEAQPAPAASTSRAHADRASASPHPD